MKHWLFAPMVAVALSPGFVSAQDTAYKALRAIGKQRGEKALNQVVAISGQSGRPQPVDWRISLDDPTARGGVREFDIVSGQISAERTPARPPLTRARPIDLTKLNLDSDGAFHMAEQEASRNQVGFDSINYQLAADSATGQPVWTLEVFDYEQRAVGTVRVAASNGTLVSSGNWVPQRGEVAVQQRPQHPEDVALAGPSTSGNQQQSGPPVAYQQPETQERKYDSAGSDSAGQSGGTVGERANRYGAAVKQFGQKVAYRTTRVFQTVGGWFQEKFTGRNTIDPKHGQPDDEDEDDDNNDQPPPPSVPYNRPAQPSDPYSRPVTPVPQD